MLSVVCFFFLMKTFLFNCDIDDLELLAAVNGYQKLTDVRIHFHLSRTLTSAIAYGKFLQRKKCLRQELLQKAFIFSISKIPTVNIFVTIIVICFLC